MSHALPSGIGLVSVFGTPPRPWHRKQRRTPEADLPAWRIHSGHHLAALIPALFQRARHDTSQYLVDLLSQPDRRIVPDITVSLPGTKVDLVLVGRAQGNRGSPIVPGDDLDGRLFVIHNNSRSPGRVWR